MDMNFDSQQLVQYLRKHFGNNNFSLDDYIHAFGNERDALLYWSFRPILH